MLRPRAGDVSAADVGATFKSFRLQPPDAVTVAGLAVDPSSICMWAYAGEICFSPPASKNFSLIIPHTVPKGRGHGFNGSIYL